MRQKAKDVGYIQNVKNLFIQLVKDCNGFVIIVDTIVIKESKRDIMKITNKDLDMALEDALQKAFRGLDCGGLDCLKESCNGKLIKMEIKKHDDFRVVFICNKCGLRKEFERVI